MGVPATLADLDPIIANNSPSGSDPIGTNLDDYLRSHAGLIKQAYTAGLMPVGTRMPFAQASAPTGWTQAVTDNEDNRMLRVVKTTGGGVAGTSSPILNNVVPSHTHTFTTGTESASHTHGITDPGHTHSVPQGTNIGAGAYAEFAIELTGNNIVSTASVTGISLGTESALHTHSGTSESNGSAANWTPRYIDMIICAKN